MFTFKLKNNSNSSPINLDQRVIDLEARIETLAEVNKALVGVIDKQKVFDLITQKLSSTVKMNFPSIWIYNKDEDTINLVSHSIPKTLSKIAEGAIGKPIQSISFSRKNLEESKSTYFKAIDTGKPIFSENLYSHTYPFLSKNVAGILTKVSGMKLAVSIPIKVDDKAIGVLSAIWKEKTLSKTTETTLFTFANQISTAIYNSFLFEKNQNQITLLENKNRDLASLYTLTSNISKTLNPTEVAQNAVTSLPQDGNLIGGIIATKNLEDNSISAKAITTNSLSENVIKLIGDPSKYKIMIDDPKFKDNVTINAIEHGKIQYTDDLKEFLSPPLPQKLVAPIQKILNIKSVAVYPIIARQKIIGSVAYLFRNEKFEDMEDAKKQLFQTYTLQIGISLENARLFTESEEIRKRLKVALEKVEELRAQERDMIDIMGHELRTPITIVRNSLLVLEGLLQSVGKIPPETLEKYIGISVESSRREIALIETLLSATKVDGNRLQFSKEKVDMVDVVNDGLEGQLRIAEEKGLKVIYEKPSKQMYSYADRLRVQEVMDNLLNNSVKYTLKGHVEIKLYEENGMIRVDIIDTGIGISKEDIAKLGRKFFRAKQYIKATSTQEKIVRPGGTGLGLYVVFNLVKKMGGRIYIESELGKGSTFGFSLPKYDGQQEIKIRENSAREQESALKASRDPKIKKELDNEAKSTS